jgi:hypothetical protein
MQSVIAFMIAAPIWLLAEWSGYLGLKWGLLLLGLSVPDQDRIAALGVVVVLAVILIVAVRITTKTPPT